MKQLFLLIVVLLSVAGFASAKETKEMSSEAKSAYATLKSVDMFALGGVGFAGTTTPGEHALRVLLKQEGASKLLQDLLKQGSTAGQVYALVGLKQCNKAAFEKEITPYLTRKSTVKTAHGCILGMESISQVAGEIQKGELQLRPEKPKPTAPPKRATA